MSWIAEYDTQGREFPTCVHVTKTTGTMTHGATYVPIEDGKAVRAENAKLREQIHWLKQGDILHVLTDQEYIDQCERERLMQVSIDALDKENAKLRELIRELFRDFANADYELKSRCGRTFMAVTRYLPRLQELEVEP